MAPDAPEPGGMRPPVICPPTSVADASAACAPRVLRGRGEPWWDEASCRGKAVATFFVSDQIGLARALAICRRCSVRTACLEYARANNIKDGVWGGLSEQERRRLGR